MNLIYSGQYKDIIGTSVFLAGCSPRKDQDVAWRKEAIELFKHWENLGHDKIQTLIIPEPETGIWDNYESVIDWELKYLNLSDIVLFWIPRNMDQKIYGLTSNVEFGYLVGRSKKIVYGRPDDADNCRYLDQIYENFYNRKPDNTIEDLVFSLYDNYIWISK